MAKWVEPQFKKGQVDRAAKALISDNLSASERAEVLGIINNWRSSHSYPLHIAKIRLQRRAYSVTSDSVSAQRLKRLSSIITKLRRNQRMQLTQMQDIGGCRAVMPTVKEVQELVQVYEEAAKKNPPKKEQPLVRPELIERYDYINNPKADGYRSHHFVFKYGSEADKQQIYCGLRIEIQIRSRLQHAWATAVETVSTFTEHALKSGMGDVRWKRFFALMGSVFAKREDSPLVPNTPSDEVVLKEELKQLYHELRVESLLTGMRAAVNMVGDSQGKSKAFLLILNSIEKTLQVESYGENELTRASQDYILVEEENTNNPSVQAVLVSVDSIATLQSA